jgi:hypothetical protein
MANTTQPNAPAPGDPDISTAVKDDPILRYLFAKRRELLGLVIAVIAGFFVVDRYREKHGESMGQAADVYAEVRRDLEVMADPKAQPAASPVPERPADPSEADVAQRRAISRLKELAEREQPYDQVSAIYQILVDLEHEHALPAADQQKTADCTDPAHFAKGPSFFVELRCLVAGRALLNEADQRANGWRLLQNLALRGKYSSVPAVVTLARVASGQDERSEVLTAIASVIQRFPEQESLLEDERQRLAPAQG